MPRLRPRRRPRSAVSKVPIIGFPFSDRSTSDDCYRYLDSADASIRSDDQTQKKEAKALHGAGGEIRALEALASYRYQGQDEPRKPVPGRKGRPVKRRKLQHGTNGRTKKNELSRAFRFFLSTP